MRCKQRQSFVLKEFGDRGCKRPCIVGTKGQPGRIGQHQMVAPDMQIDRVEAPAGLQCCVCQRRARRNRGARRQTESLLQPVFMAGSWEAVSSLDRPMAACRMSAAKPGARAACASRSDPSQAGSTRLAASSSAGGLSADRTGFKAKHPQEGEKQGQKRAPSGNAITARSGMHAPDPAGRCGEYGTLRRLGLRYPSRIACPVRQP